MIFIAKRLLLPALLLASGLTSAQIRLPKVIGSNMVLQQKQQLPIWGWASPGKTIKVSLANQVLTAVAAKDSSWHVSFSPLEASWTPQTLLIQSDDSKVLLDNILIGEVWLCSGQSNMEYQMKKGNYKAPAKGADSAALELGHPNGKIRLFNVQKKLSAPDVTSTGWSESRAETFEKASAAGYFFAKELQAKLNVPVGIITSAWGGSRIEVWTPPQAYKAIPAFAKDGAEIDNVKPGRNFASMISPLSPFAIKGVLWYQGESNCMLEEQNMRYAYKMQALIESWRNQWNTKDLPFYYVLVAPYNYTRRKDPKTHTTETLPLFWEQQVAASKIPQTGFVTITDLVDVLTDIHPSYKWEVGRRLALVALDNTYKEKNTVSSGPEFLSMEKKKGKVILRFANAEGLKTRDGANPNFFTVAGKDGKFVSAEAVIEGKTIVVSNAAIKKPVNVRFAWTEAAIPNLINNAGLPAVPFRTDAEKWAFAGK